MRRIRIRRKGKLLRWLRKPEGRRALGAFLLVFLGLWFWNRPEPPPKQVDDLCELFEEKPSWYRSARRSQDEFRISIGLQMAVLRHESGFRAKARPPRRKILWIFPGPRLSTAFGYAQVLDSTWDDYRTQTGRAGARRHRFGDAIHFAGWYLEELHHLTGVPRDGAEHLYLAYHEGPGGYRQGTWRDRPDLRRLARGIAQRAKTYQQQLEGCRSRLEMRLRLRQVGWFVLALLLVGLSFEGLRWLLRRRPKT